MKACTLHLAATGSDPTGDGSRRRPFASLSRAIEQARRCGAAKRRIVVGDGAYHDVEATLEAADSGLEIVAAPGASPAFYGGQPVRDWREEGGGSPFWTAPIAGAREGLRDFRALVVNGRFAPRARFPEEGKIKHASTFPVRWMSTTKGGWERRPTEQELTTLKLVPGILPEGISEKNAELTIYHSWDESLVGIKHWDRAAGLITFSTPAGHPPGAFAIQDFTVWNVREGMTAPGQWYLDREHGRVVYWPLPGEKLEALDVLAPTRSTVLRLAGTAEAPVRGVRLKGLAFGVTTTPLRSGGFGARAFDGAIGGQYAHGLRLEQVTVRWAGGQGVKIEKSDGVRCTACTIQDLGAGGALLSGRGGVVTGTLIHHNGLTYPSAIGLSVSGERFHLHHNTIHHTPYSALVIDGSRHRIEHNRFHHVMEILEDGAAIYAGGLKHSVVRGNYTYEVREAHAHAYYLDEQCADSLVAKNVSVGVYWPIHNHMAWACLLRDNVCLHEKVMRISFFNCDNFTLAHNVFAGQDALIVDTSYTGVRTLRGNCFYSRTGSVRWEFHDRLPSLERNAGSTPALPRNQGSVVVNPGCRCENGVIVYEDRALAEKLRLPALDMRGAGCGRD